MGLFIAKVLATIQPFVRMDYLACSDKHVTRGYPFLFGQEFHLVRDELECFYFYYP